MHQVNKYKLYQLRQFKMYMTSFFKFFKHLDLSTHFCSRDAQRHRNIGRAGGAVKMLMAMETYVRQKIVTNACYCSTTI